MNSVYRVAWRAMAATTGFRTLYPAVIPPGARHVNGIFSFTHSNLKVLAATGAVMSSFVCDFFLRINGAANIFPSVIDMLPCINDSKVTSEIARRYLALNCLTEAYAPIWEECTGEHWAHKCVPRTAYHRMQLQTEIDALVGLSLGLDIEDLITIYQSQFPVMRRYDNENYFDVHGRTVPKEVLKAYENNPDQKAFAWKHPQSEQKYMLETPFRNFDRVKLLRENYENFLNFCEQ